MTRARTLHRIPRGPRRTAVLAPVLAAALVPLALFPLLARPELGLALAACVVAGLLAWMSPAWPLALAGLTPVVLLIGSSAQVGNLPSLATFAWTAAGIAFALRHPDRPRLRVLLAAPVALTLILGVVLLARLPGSAGEAYGSAKLQLFAALNVIGLVAGLLVGRNDRHLRLFLALSLAVGALFAVALLTVILGGGDPVAPGRYAPGEGYDPISLGRASATGVLIALFLVLTARGGLRLLGLALMPVVAIATLASGSRGPLLGLMAGSVVLLAVLAREGSTLRARLPAVAALVVAVGALASQLVPGDALQRSLSVLTGQEEGRAADWRVTWWADAWTAFAENPVAGVGTGGFAPLSTPPEPYPHNLFLEAAAEWGLLGLLPLLGILVLGAAGTVRALRARSFATRTAAALALALLTSALGNAMVSGDITTNAQVWVAVGLGLGIATRAPAHLRPPARRLAGVGPVPSPGAGPAASGAAPRAARAGRRGAAPAPVGARHAPAAPSRGRVPRVRRRLAALLPPGGMRASVAVLAGGFAVAQAITLLLSPIVSRLYSPSDFGAFAAAAALVAVAVTVTCLTYDQAIPLPDEDDTAADLLVLAVLAAAMTTAATTLALLVAGERLLGVFDVAAIAPYVWLLVAIQFVGAVQLALTSWTGRRRRFSGVAVARIGQSAATGTVQVAAGAAGMAAPGLLLGDAAGRIAGVARLLAGARREDGLRVLATTPRRLARAAVRYRRFPLLSSWGMLLNAVSLGAPLLLLVALYGATTGGLFAFAQRLVLAPVSLLVLAIGQVYFVEGAERARESLDELRRLFVTSVRRLGQVAAVAVLLIPVPAILLVGTVFGEQWREAGVYIAILTPLYLVQLVSSPFGATLAVLERQDLIIVRETVRVALLASAIVAAKVLGLPALGAVALFSVAGTLAYAFYGGISLYAINARTA